MFSVQSLLLIIIVIMIYNDNFVEKFCTYCDSYYLDEKSMIALNPFVHPFSGTSTPDDIRVLEYDRKVNINSYIPLTSASVADHASQTN